MVTTPLEIKWEITETEKTYRFVLRSRQGTPLEFVLRDEYGVPYRQKAYSIRVGDRTYEGNTGEAGLVSQQLPSTAQAAELTIWLDADDPDDTLTYQLDLTPLPPITEIRGVQIRLHNLGYEPGDVTGEINDQTREAIKDFQEFIGHATPMGELDEQTRTELVRMHDGG